MSKLEKEIKNLKQKVMSKEEELSNEKARNFVDELINDPGFVGNISYDIIEGYLDYMEMELSDDARIKAFEILEKAIKPALKKALD